MAGKSPDMDGKKMLLSVTALFVPKKASFFEGLKTRQFYSRIESK